MEEVILTGVTARVSPNGRWLAFMSGRRLTGYDNTDVSEREVLSGEGKQHADEEVYLYHAEASPSGQLGPGSSCARRVTRRDSAPKACSIPAKKKNKSNGSRHCSSTTDGCGKVVGWLGTFPAGPRIELNGAQYQSRYLSNNGRLFFNSPDALVPADVNKKENVYEYEPEGVGDCQITVAGAGEVFEPASGGCVGLISSGTSSQESAFLDASATGGRDNEGDEGGGDVFFMTTSQLAPQDVDQAYDIYDAHECTASSPCISQAAPAVPPACNNEASCKAAPETQPTSTACPPAPPSQALATSPTSATAEEGRKEDRKCKARPRAKIRRTRCVRKPGRKPRPRSLRTPTK